MERNVLIASHCVHKNQLVTALLTICFAVVLSFSAVYAQEEDEEGIFWGDEGEFEEFGEDEFFGEGEEFLDEEGFLDEEDFLGEEDEFLEEEFLEPDEYLLGAEEEEEPPQTGVDLADEARREGFSIQVSAASTGYVNHTLSTWNSLIDFRGSVDFPFLMQIGPIKFRLGAEVTTFSFENSLPVGGEFSGIGFLGLVTFPAGPSSVQVGAGVMGSSPAYVVAQSFGFSLANLADVRIGVRSTNAFGLPEDMNATGARASWLDGFITVGYTL
ncbi:MAG: hypothetical protein V3U24_02885 [Candidatus Neomarinimicrobiota bacterium]